MTDQLVSRWARRYVLASAAFLIIWQAGLVVEALPRRAEVVLGLYGFVLHVVFGKASSLIPAYFDRSLAFPRAIAVQFPFSVGGTIGLLAGSLPVGPAGIGALGATLWVLGIIIFVGTLGWTIRTNLTGHETATSDAKADRRPLDRLSNAFVPIVIGYLTLGSYETLALYTALPASILGGSPVAVSHLLGPGTAVLLVFAVGFRLLPRFLVASPPRIVPSMVLVAGATGPALLAGHFGGGRWFQIGAILEAVAVVGFGLCYSTMFYRSNRRRVSFYGPLLGVLSGTLAVGLGLSFAFGPLNDALVRAHLRVNLLGFLGLTIIGVLFQFYPPAIGEYRGANDRTALLTIGALAAGLLVQALGLAVEVGLVMTLGAALTTVAAGAYTYLMLAAFRAS